MPPTHTPMALITGSLGSGKTTLLKRIIAAAAGKLAVLMNEFGELGIDSPIIAGKLTRIIELAGGCVCCGWRNLTPSPASWSLSATI